MALDDDIPHITSTEKVKLDIKGTLFSWYGLFDVPQQDDSIRTIRYWFRSEEECETFVRVMRNFGWNGWKRGTIIVPADFLYDRLQKGDILV